MLKRRLRTVAPALACVVALGIFASSQVAAQVSPWRIAQGSDGTMYLIVGGGRYTIAPDAISDDELATLPDEGTIGGQLPLPPVPAIAVLTSAPTATAVVAAAPTATPVPVQAEQPVTVSGSGEMNSKPFALRGGNYTVSWAVTVAKGGYGYFSAGLVAVDPQNHSTAGAGSATFDSGQTKTGENQAYNLAPGQYYIHMSTAGVGTIDWKVTVTPQ
jgi:hypothetical protein